MKYLDFEKHIKKELEGSKETVQMDALLTSLNLGKEPKNKRFALWMILPFLLLVISGFAWNFMDFNNNDDSNSLFTEQVSNQKDIYKENSITETNLKLENEAPILKTLEKDESIKDTNANLLKSNTTEVSSKDIKSFTTFPTIAKSPPARQSQQSSNLQHSSQNNLNEGLQNSILSSSFTNQTKTSPQVGEDRKDISSAEGISSLSRDMVSIANLENSIDILTDNEMDAKLFSRMKINCPSFDNASWHLALIPEVGIFLPLKTLEINDFEESAAFNERLTSESTLEGLELGLHGMLVRDNVPFYLKAGISYSRISERMDLKYEYTVMDTTYGIISSTVSSNGDTITDIYGDIFSEITYKGSNRQHYYIHMFDIPISVGYTTYIAGLDVGIEAGVKVNFMTRATGNLLTSQIDYTNLSLNKMYKNRIGVNYFGGLMIGRNFGRFGDIYIAPRFTYYPNEFNNSNNNISQKYFTVGLNAGIVYKIN